VNFFKNYMRQNEVNPLISVVMITYKHKEYISDAIEGVLNQEFGYPVELIIADDCSPDETSDIVRKYIDEHPNGHWIKYHRQTKNIGMMPNFIWALENCRGKYVALCEGDDFWTHPLKLKRQFDFMELHKNHSFCFHSVRVIRVNELDKHEYEVPKLSDLSLSEIIRKHYVPTCSVFFRRSCIKDGLPKWFKYSISGDIPLEIILASKGNVKYLSESMACYRRNEGGISQSSEQIKKMRKGYIEMYGNLAREISFRYSFYLRLRVLRLRMGYIKVFFRSVFR
jgi:glycosyltransferase involved in cell wall biosynthesis